jgi:uncharacterized protein YegJ (DUF2314 family)
MNHCTFATLPHEPRSPRIWCPPLSPETMHQPLRRLPLLAWFLLLLLGLSCQARAAVPIAAGSLTAGPIRYQFAIYYPAAPAKPPMAVLRERLAATGNAPKLVNALPDPPAAPVIQARLETDVKKNYAPPSLDMLQRFGRGLTRDQAQALQGARQALILDFAHPASLSASAHRASLQLTEQVARDTHGLLWDEETREVFTPDEWHQRRLESWDGDTPEVPRHIVIHAYQGDKLIRAITLGMAKFGLPDVVVDEFSWSSNRSVSNLINLLAQAIAEGGAVRPRGLYELDVRSIRHAAVRRAHVEGLGPKGTGVAALMLVKGTWEDGDPRNRLVEIRFDRGAGPDRHARQDSVLSALFGAEDSVTHVKHTKELLDASKAAAARLPALRDAFARGLQPGEFILVKAPFAIPDGGNEWMWVEITAWDGDAITGLLKNDPANIPTLHAGQVVKVSQRKVFDYIRRDAAGREEGNETGKILERQQGGRK